MKRTVGACRVVTIRVTQSASAFEGTVQGDYDRNSLDVFNFTVIRRF